MENIRKEILSFYNDLKFNEEKHQYLVGDKKIKYSVSGLIKKFVEEVDFSQKAVDKDRRLGLPIGTTQKEWDKVKKAACEKGNSVHLFGELYPFNKQLQPKNKYEEAVVKFWNSIPSKIVPVITELQMYHKNYMFAGTADILLYNTVTDNFILGDFKTNKDLFKNYKGKRMLKPFGELLDNPYNKYQLQLSFYQMLFEQLGLKVSSRKLIWLRPDGNYEMYVTNDYTEVLKNYLKNNEL